MFQKARQIALPVMCNTELESEMRVAAFHVLMETILSGGAEKGEMDVEKKEAESSSGELLLAAIAQRMQIEPSMHVKSFVYSALKSLARSTPEHYKPISRVARSALKHMTPVRSGMMSCILCHSRSR